MRISSSMLYSQLLRGLQDQISELNDLSLQLSTGKRIARPSEDVLGTEKAMDYKLSITQNDQYGQNMTEAGNFLKFNDTVLNQVSETLSELKNLSYEGGDTTGTAADRAYYAERAANLRDYLLDLSNSQFRDRTIYSGFKSDQKAYEYDAVTHRYSYQGDSGQLRLAISRETNLAVNYVGSSADPSISTTFSYTLSAVETKTLSDGNVVSYTAVPDPVLGITAIQVSITHPDHPGDPEYEDQFSFSNFMEMADLLSHAWQYEEVDGTSVSESKSFKRIQALSIPLEKAEKQISTIQAQLSTRQLHLTDQKVRLETRTGDLKNNLSEIEDADMTKTAVELQQLTTSLEALRMASTKILSQSLFDFLS